MPKISTTKSIARICDEMREVTQCVRRELVRSKALVGPDDATRSLADIVEKSWLDRPLRRRQKKICLAALFVQKLTNDVILGAQVHSTIKGTLEAHDRYAAVGAIDRHDARVSAEQLAELYEQLFHYRPLWHFCYELRHDGFELKAISRVIHPKQSDILAKQIQDWLHRGVDISVYASLARCGTELAVRS